MTTKIKISKKLYKEISELAKKKGRTVAEQLEICARLGMIAENTLLPEEIELILKGSSWTLKVVPIHE